MIFSYHIHISMAKQELYKWTSRALIYSIQDSIAYIQIILQRDELANILAQESIPLKHDGQIDFEYLQETDVEYLQWSGGLPWWRIDNKDPNYLSWIATNQEKEFTIIKEIKEELGFLLNKDFTLSNIWRDNTRKKETQVYKEFLAQKKQYQEQRIHAHPEKIQKVIEKQDKDKIATIKIPWTPSIGYGEDYDFNLEYYQQYQDINEHYHLAFKTHWSLTPPRSAEQDAIDTIWGFALLPIHRIYQQNQKIILGDYDIAFSEIFKYPSDRLAFHKLRTNPQIKEQLIQYIEWTKKLENHK